jgi:hypothetical protein
MKRLMSMSLTEEDNTVWMNVRVRFARLCFGEIGLVSMESDRRDAELMLYLTHAKLPFGWGVYRHRGMPKAWWLIPRVEA